MNNIDLEAIKARIAKLRKHAQSADKLGSKEEAIAFAAKANELLLEYNLLESDIKMDDDSDKYKKWAYSERLSFQCKQSGQRSKLKLVGVLCRHNLCDYVYNGSPWFTFEVFGNMENVDQVVWLYNFLSVGLLRLAQQAHVALSKEEKIIYNRYSYLKDFLLGAATGIDAKLKQQTADSAQSAGICAMVLYNKDALSVFLKTTKPKTRSVKQRQVIVGHGFTSGVEAGKSFSITKPLESKSKTIKQLK
jgi:hypothetical protein